jgi:hypothetical protein
VKRQGDGGKYKMKKNESGSVSRIWCKDHIENTKYPIF